MTTWLLLAILYVVGADGNALRTNIIHISTHDTETQCETAAAKIRGAGLWPVCIEGM